MERQVKMATASPPTVAQVLAAQEQGSWSGKLARGPRSFPKPAQQEATELQNRNTPHSEGPRTATGTYLSFNIKPTKLDHQSINMIQGQEFASCPSFLLTSGICSLT